jgi:hypothetical protein
MQQGLVALVLLAAAAFAPPAAAAKTPRSDAPPDAAARHEAGCRDAADGARAVARRRDEGATEEEMRRGVELLLIWAEGMPEGEQEEVRHEAQIAQFAIPWVYGPGHPSQEATEAWYLAECRRAPELPR